MLKAYFRQKEKHLVQRLNVWEIDYLVFLLLIYLFSHVTVKGKQMGKKKSMPPDTENELLDGEFESFISNV